MPKVNDLQIAAWSAESLLEQSLKFTRFRLSDDAQCTILEWCRENTNRAGQPVRVGLFGLSEVTGLLVPEIAFLRDDWDSQIRAMRLSFYFLQDCLANGGLRKRMHVALSQWLGIVHRGKSAATRADVAKCALDDANWTVINVNPTLTRRSTASACPGASDRLLWDAISAHAVAAVAGKKFEFRSDERSTLIVKTPQSNLFGGVELVAYPPKPSPDRKKFWSEVVTLCTATFPEQPGVYLLARLSLRNWGPVTAWQRHDDPHRSLDVFMAPDPDYVGPVASGWRHSSFDYRAKFDRDGGPITPGQERPPIATWRHEEERDVFHLLQALTGNVEAARTNLAQPMFNPAGLSVLPRLSAGQGDDRLSGGTGLPWPDREDIADSLDGFFSEIGLKRAAPMRRVSRRVRNPPKCVEDAAAWRQSVLAALKDVGNENGHLDLLLFRGREDTPRAVRDELRILLGEPRAEQEGVLRWSDGLTIRVSDFAAGPLAEQFPEWPKLTPTESSKYINDQQRKAFQRTKQQGALDAARQRMVEHVAQARREANPGIACALLEMSSDVAKDPWRDPFGMAREELARARCLPKVVLTSEDQSEHKYRFALRDLFRLLGVSPVSVPVAHTGRTLAAVTIIQRNGKIVSGRKRKEHAFPLAARVQRGVLQCAVPEADEFRWMPYAQAVLQVITGEYEHFERGRQSEPQFERFFSAVLADLGQEKDCLVLMAKNLVSKVRTLQNGDLEFDRLAFGNQVFQASDLPSVRVVRVDNDRTKQPSYSHGTDAKWPSGLFDWGEATRTFYALKPKPRSVSMKSSFAVQVSRHGSPLDEPVLGGRSHTDTVRVTPQPIEFCAAFVQPGDEAYDLIGHAFALCTAHVQYDYHTNLPFPLHELMCIGKNVTG